MILKNFFRIVSVCAFLFVTSCASLSHRFDADRARVIRKVAVLGFEIQQEKATDNLKLGGFKSIKEGRDGESTELQEMAEKTAYTLAQKLQEKTKWQVVPMKDVINNPEYKKIHDSLMTGMRSVLIVSENLEPVLLKGVLDVAGFRKLTQEQRQSLAKALGVDAVIEVFITQKMEQSMFSLGHLTGDAAFSLTARFNLQAYDKSSDEPFWRNQNVDGNKSDNSDSLPKEMSKRARLSKLGTEASISAINKALESYSL